MIILFFSLFFMIFFFFISSSRLFSFLRFSLLFSSLVLSLILHVSFFFLSFFFSFLFSLFSLLFHLLFLSLSLHTLRRDQPDKWLHQLRTAMHHAIHWITRESYQSVNPYVTSWEDFTCWVKLRHKLHSWWCPSVHAWFSCSTFNLRCLGWDPAFLKRYCVWQN